MKIQQNATVVAVVSCLRSPRIRLLGAGTFLLISVWAVLYLPHIRTNPGWYGDETLAVTAAQNILPGPPAHRAFWNTFWHPYAPYQPGYLLAVAAALALTGDIVGPRIFNALLGLATALVMLMVGRRVLGYIPSLFAALVFLTYEQSVIHFRWIFTHNLIAFGFTLAFLELARRSTFRNNFRAGLGIAAGASALPLFVYGAFAAGLWRIRHPRSWFPLAIPSFAVVSVSLLWGWIAHEHPFLLTDIAATADFYTDASRENSGSLAGLATNLWIFFTHDWLHVLGGVAILLCWNRRSRAIGFGATAISILLLQNRQNLPVFYYQAVVLLPLMVLAIGNALGRGMRLSRRLTGSRFASRAAAMICFLLPVILFVSVFPKSIGGKLIPRNQFWVTQSPSEVEAAAEWINEQVAPNDLVICHQNIAWLIRCRTADFLMMTSYAGLPTWPFKTPLTHQQFRYAVDVNLAKFVVVGDIDQRWTFSQPNVAAFTTGAMGDRWEAVWAGENYRVFRKKGTRP